MAKFNPNQKTIWAKKSSLAIEIYKEDDDSDLYFYVFNRRTHSIIAFYRIPLMEHCRNSMLNVDPIPRKRTKKPSKK